MKFYHDKGKNFWKIIHVVQKHLPGAHARRLSELGQHGNLNFQISYQWQNSTTAYISKITSNWYLTISHCCQQKVPELNFREKQKMYAHKYS